MFSITSLRSIFQTSALLFRVSARLSRADRINVPFARKSLERLRAAIVEADAGARDEIFHGARDQHLARARQRRDSGAGVHGDAAQLVAEDLALARVQTGANLQAQLPHLAHDGACTTHAARRSVEAREKPIAGRIDFATPKAHELLANRRVMPILHLSPTALAHTPSTLRRATD